MQSIRPIRVLSHVRLAQHPKWRIWHPSRPAPHGTSLQNACTWGRYTAKASLFDWRGNARSHRLQTATAAPIQSSRKACLQPPPSVSICGGSGRLYILRLASTDNPVLSLVLKRPITKFQCLVAKDYRKTVCRCLVHRPRYSARLVCLRFGSRCRSEFFFSDTPPQCLARDCVGRSRTGTTHSNVYRSVREKTENCCLSSKCFKNSDISACCFTSISSARPLKITNINPQQEARFSPRKEKTWFFERAADGT